MFFIIQRPWKTSKVVFQSVISIWKESRWSENSSKISEKCQIWVRNFDENFVSSKFFLILYCNVNTFRIIHKTWKAFIVVSQAVNDTSGSAHELQGSLKTHEIVKFRSGDRSMPSKIRHWGRIREKKRSCVSFWSIGRKITDSLNKWLMQFWRMWRAVWIEINEKDEDRARRIKDWVDFQGLEVLN